MSERRVVKIVTGHPTSDGAGVRLRRVIGTQDLDHLDPFLLLDEFKSDRPDDYLAGFPDHPHRGFETVTYMLAGSMRHQDHVGNRGELVAGSVQWMTAGTSRPRKSPRLRWPTARAPVCWSVRPAVRYGPFVMNTREEILQAVQDYQRGTLLS